MGGALVACTGSSLTNPCLSWVVFADYSSTIEENILKKANQKKKLGEITIEGGGFTTDFFKKSSMFELFEGEKVLAEIKATKETAKEEETQDSGPSNQAELEQALAGVEDDTDREATTRVVREARDELVELDDSKPFPADQRAAPSSTSEAESAAEEDPRLDLDAQLARLQGVEKHALHVLER